MVSPEILRRYPFFGTLNDAQNKAVAMIAEEGEFNKGDTLFEECDPADALYLLMTGSIDLYFRSEEPYHPTARKEFTVGEINPGEVFGISALIAPYVLNATARAAQAGTYVKFDAKILHELLEQDIDLAYKLMVQATRETLGRLAATRVQLAAALS